MPCARWRTAAHSGFLKLLVASSLGLLVLVALPLICVKVPLSADYVNHLARNYIIAFGDSDPFLSKFYVIQWKLIPNLAMDLVVPPLARLVGIFTAGKLFILMYMILVSTGPQAIHRALFRRFSLGPLIAALFIYNHDLTSGILNYLFGIGVSLWGLAAWIALRQRHYLVRSTVSLAFILVLFVTHLAAVGLYGLGILAYETWIFWGRGHRIDRRVWLDTMVFAGPFFAVPILMALGPIVDFVGSTQWGPIGRKVYSIISGLRDVIRTGPTRFRTEICVALAMAAPAGVAWWYGRVRVHPVGWFLLGLAVPIYLAMPWRLLSAEWVDSRLPIGVVFLGLGMLDWNLPSPREQWKFVIIVYIFVFVRVGIVAAQWLPFRTIVADLETSLQDVKVGSRVLIAYPHHSPEAWGNLGLQYLPCLAIIERSSLVSLEFSHPAQQVLAVRQPFREFAGGYNDDPLDISDILAERLPAGSPRWSRLYWKDWMVHYDYVYLIWDTNSENPAPDHLIELYRGEDFRLYRIIKKGR